MAKIAAVILPHRLAGRLPALHKNMYQSLCLYTAHQVESKTYHGAASVCTLLRVSPDPLNPQPQPVDLYNITGVSCGYYLSGSSTGDSAPRLFSALDGGGVDALPKGDGVYAFAYWDKQRECLVAGVDKLGMRPLYWASLPGGGYAVASEVKALACLLDDLTPNWSAWEEMLSFGFMFGEHTALSNVQRFGVAEAITFRHDRHDSQTVENFLETIDVVDRPFGQFLEEQGAVYDRAMSRLTALYDAANDTMLTLSGGYDSRRAFAWLLNQGIHPDTYTVPEILADGREIESSIVKQACESVGVQANSVSPQSVFDRMQLRAMRDLATDFESDEHEFLMVLAMGLDCHDKVNFDGLAAGTQLMGSFVRDEHFQAGGQERFMSLLPQSAPTWLNLPKPESPPFEERIRAELERWGDNPNRFAYFYMLSRTRREIALAPLALQANVFESLCPYLDREMMRSALSFPPERKVGAHTQFHLIKALHPVLGSVPTVYSQEAVEFSERQCRIRKSARRRRRKLLEYSTDVSKCASGWSTEPFQAMRFYLCQLLTASGYDHQLQWSAWQYEKARRISQLGHFQTIAGSPETYQAAINSLKTAYGQKKNWKKSL